MDGIPVGVILFAIYMFVAHIFTIYFWFLWAQTHSFMSTLFIGPFVSEFKGLLFPFFM
jgi:hypothetical protein